MTEPHHKKLIEVALPLEAINREAAREKSIHRGHPSTLHLWWTRKPLAACRAVLFASLVDDPSSHPEQFPTEEAQEAERQRLFRIIEQLVRWENTTNERVLDAARAEVLKATDGNPPPVLDPFCGGGSIPLEAQRLGLEVHASDLNPVAVLITKALIEIPPRFAGRPPVNPEARRKIGHSDGWRGVQGLAEDVRYYGKWMRDEAERRIGHLYPKVRLPAEQGGGEATVIAWLWVRAVKCPNPACGAQMPLATKFWLSRKANGPQAWVEPLVDQALRKARFEVQSGHPSPSVAAGLATGTALVNEKGKKVQAAFRCIVCRQGIAKGDYIDSEANSGHLAALPLAVVAEGGRGRIYATVDDRHLRAAEEARLAADSMVGEGAPTEPARGTFASNAQGRIYGFKSFRDYFTDRQLLALTTFGELVDECRVRVVEDMRQAGVEHAFAPPWEQTSEETYADAVATYLALVVDKCSDYWSSVCSWNVPREIIRNTFSRQAIAMAWDFAEANPFSGSAANFEGAADWVAAVLRGLSPSARQGVAVLADAANGPGRSRRYLVSTDPPYYDNVSYADLSDFFYVWLRRSIGRIYPELFSTYLTPKAEELIASPYRFDGSRVRAQEFFEHGLGQAFASIREAQEADYPMTVFYAFKQAESENDEDGGGSVVASTGWETMLEGLVGGGFSIHATWPLRSELGNRMTATGANALASSIVLACRPRAESATITMRRDFVAELKRELPPALKTLQREAIAPVDLAQAAIGPGMAVFSKYHRVLEADGSSMPVRTALALINQALDEVLAEQEGEFDPETRWAVAWFEQFGMNEGVFGVAETLSKAKNTAVNALVEAGLVAARGGKVRLLGRDELSADWDPVRDRRVTIWEVTQHLIRALDQGEEAAARLLGRVGSLGETARDLAYRLYSACERKKWAQEALGYNSLVVAWPEISRLAGRDEGPEQAGLGI